MRITLFILLCCLLVCSNGQAQSYPFRHLTTTEGLLSDLRLVMTEDRQGRLWIGSDEGINIFDGYQLSSYDQPDSTVMNTNSVQQIYCDKKGTIWIATPQGVLYKNETDSRFRKLSTGTIPLTNVLFFGETTDADMLIASRNNCYLLKNDERLTKLTGLEKLYNQYGTLVSLQHLTGDEWLMAFRYKLLHVNIKQQRLIKELQVTNVWCAAMVNDSMVMTGSFAQDTISLVNIRTGSRETINHWPASDGKPIGGYAGSIEPAGNNKFAIASRYHGVYLVDLEKHSALALQHDPSDPASLRAMACRRLFISRNSTMFVQSRGISFTQLSTPQFKSQKFIANAAGERYDGGFTTVLQDGKKNFWLGTNAFLAAWNRKTNTCNFYPFYDVKRGPQKFKTVRTVVKDKLDRIWVGTFGGGIGLLLPNGGYQQFRPDSLDREHSIPNIDVHSIAKDKHENFIVCTNMGFGLFDPIARKAQTYFNHPTLKKIARQQTFYAMADEKDNWWLAQAEGLYYYDRQADSVHTILAKDDKAIKQGQVLATDSSGMLYVGALDGLYIIAPATLKVQKIIGKKDGLASNNIVGLLCDKAGMLWILGNIGVARYNPVTTVLQSFDARDGIEQSNHTLCNFFMADDGEVFLTSSEGFNYFYPEKIKGENKPLQVYVTAIELKDSIISMPKQVVHAFEYYQNNVSFSYLSVDFRLGTSIQYRYKLQGFDTSFTYAGKQRTARYTNLPAGKYVFTVEASVNGKDWYTSSTPVTFSIDKAFWKTWFFIAIMLALLAGLLFLVFLFRVKKVRREEALKRDFEGKISQVRMNLLRTQMNPHFLFNSLNSINSFILKNDRQNASGYLTKFSRLMRLILDNSRNEWVSLDSELKSIELYIQLEALRFNHSFEYKMATDATIDLENVLLPPMLIQPYIENAIWHGLMYRKEPGGFLAVNIMQQNGTLQVQVTDNGVGRAAAAALKSKSALQQKSYGMKITAERMNIVNEIYQINAQALVTDLKDATGNPSGTEVLLTLDKIVDKK